MHPEIARTLSEQRQADLLRQAERRRWTAQARRAQIKRAQIKRAQGQRAQGQRAQSHWARGHWARGQRAQIRWAPVRWARVRWGRGAVPASQGVPAGVFLAGPQAFGFRSYLTAAEAQQLAGEWAEVLSRYADRVADPARRPADAVPFEVVVLGQQVPDLVGAASGRPGAASRGPAGKGPAGRGPAG